MALNKHTSLKNLKKFDVDLQFGAQFENLVDDVFTGKATVEVKTERDKWVSSGNFVIEIAYRGKPSGLAATESTYWFHNFTQDGELMFSLMVPVKVLLRILQRLNRKRVLRLKHGGDYNQSTLILVPITYFVEELVKEAKYTKRTGKTTKHYNLKNAK